MPHALLASFDFPETPVTHDGITYEFITRPYKRHGVIGVEAEGHHFLLKYIQKDNGTLVKTDKTTRIPKLGIIKKAINGFGDVSGAVVANTNTNITKKDPEYPNYKDLEFFLSEFAYDKEIWVEVGFGSGRHLLHNAKTNPDVIHIGLEIHKPSAEQVLKQCKLQHIDNLFVVDFDARIFLEILPANSVKRIFVHFPVPWDKAPHRRVMSKGFIDEAVTVLEENGTLELRTDSKAYMDYSYALFMDLDTCRLDAKKNHFLEVSSKYEDRWKKMEKDFYDLTFTNVKQSKPKKRDFDFRFKNGIPFEEFVERIGTETILEKEYLISAKEKYPMAETGSGLVKLTMGAFGTPQSLYLLFADGRVEYYPKIPYPTQANIQAHKKLEAIIDGNDHKSE